MEINWTPSARESFSNYWEAYAIEHDLRYFHPIREKWEPGLIMDYPPAIQEGVFIAWADSLQFFISILSDRSGYQWRWADANYDGETIHDDMQDYPTRHEAIVKALNLLIELKFKV